MTWLIFNHGYNPDIGPTIPFPLESLVGVKKPCNALKKSNHVNMKTKTVPFSLQFVFWGCGSDTHNNPNNQQHPSSISLVRLYHFHTTYVATKCRHRTQTPKYHWHPCCCFHSQRAYFVPFFWPYPQKGCQMKLCGFRSQPCTDSSWPCPRRTPAFPKVPEARLGWKLLTTLGRIMVYLAI